jgi:hypothetical protein
MFLIITTVTFLAIPYISTMLPTKVDLVTRLPTKVDLVTRKHFQSQSYQLISKAHSWIAHISDLLILLTKSVIIPVMLYSSYTPRHFAQTSSVDRQDLCLSLVRLTYFCVLHNLEQKFLVDIFAALKPCTRKW